MNGVAYFYWFEATQTAYRTQQLGEFSEAEIAARLSRAPRPTLAHRVAAAVAGWVSRGATLRTALRPTPKILEA